MEKEAIEFYNIHLGKEEEEKEEEDEIVVNTSASASIFELDSVPTNALSDLTDAWVNAYKSLMEKSIDQFHTLLGGTQKSYKLVSQRDRVSLYERNEGKTYGYYTWKTTAVFDVYADRLFWVIKDFRNETRLKWDSQSTVSVDELESFDTSHGPIRVYKMEEKYNLPLFWNRIFLGIGWKHFNRQTNTYKFIFRTTQHRLYKCPPKKVNVVCLFGVVIRVLDKPNRCECNIIQFMNPGDSVPAPVVEMLRNRFFEKMFLYESVAKNWKEYYHHSRDSGCGINK